MQFSESWTQAVFSTLCKWPFAFLCVSILPARHSSRQREGDGVPCWSDGPEPGGTHETAEAFRTSVRVIHRCPRGDTPPLPLPLFVCIVAEGACPVQKHTFFATWRGQGAKIPIQQGLRSTGRFLLRHFIQTVMRCRGRNLAQM